LAILSIYFVVVFLTGCQSLPETPLTSTTPAPDQTPTEQQSEAINQPTSTPEIPLPPYKIWVDSRLPTTILDITSHLNDFQNSSQSEAQVLLTSEPGWLIGHWLYLAVSPFTSLRESISSKDLQNAWRSGSGDDIDIYVSDETNRSLQLIWGESNQLSVFSTDKENIFPALLSQPDSIAIIPFEQLNPYYKVLSVDQQHPLDPDFQIVDYHLKIELYFSSSFSRDIFDSTGIDISNFNPHKLTSVALTGVTAMVRDTAAIMEENGITYPGLDVQGILTAANITHISNEVPFAEDCPAPDPNQASLFFCSKDVYIQLLDFVGADIIELSGDHFGDWGPSAMLHSLDLYHQHGWLTYGGGETLQAGLEPVFIEHNGNQLAFIGCNGKAHDRYATASETNPGASRCDFEWMLPKISTLVDQGYIVIATMQHEEVDSFQSIAIQQFDFRRIAEAGASIVSGSQAHHPQSFEFYGDSFIHYGLGNLFFDQWYLAQYFPSRHLNKDKSFIDLHYFYNGEYINTRLIPLLFVDNAHPRLMTVEEKVEFLEEVYRASRWNTEEE
jgi:poly-gamma-glutamate synthesis protein (capsule biosynthesis protein)